MTEENESSQTETTGCSSSTAGSCDGTATLDGVAAAAPVRPIVKDQHHVSESLNTHTKYLSRQTEF